MDDPIPSSQGMLSRALGLLTCFDPSDRELSAAELSRRTGMPRSTTHRLATELVQTGMLERLPGGHFRLGMPLFELGQMALSQRGLRESAAAYLADLANATHQSVNLAILDGTEVVYLDIINPTPAPRSHITIGGRLPATATAVGKAILAFSPPSTMETIFSSGLKRLTPHSITDETRLRNELAEIRRTGIAYDNQEQAMGMTCCAAPIFGYRGDVLAGVSVSGHTGVLHFNLVIAAVRSAAAGISRLQGAGTMPHFQPGRGVPL
jgi:DNA-binding IclR family transcriptional regulator